MSYIQHSKPTITKDDIQNVVSILESNSISSGNLNKEFESLFRGYIGSLEGKVVNSGRSALFLALKALGVKANDEVLIPTYVCSSVLNTIELIGAKSVILDIGDDYCLNREIIEKNLTINTKAVILVHTFGMSADIKPIQQLLKEKNIYLIEDCAHAVGGEYNNQKLGSFGDLSFFSFQATKMLTSGEGGVVVLNNDKFYDSFKKVVSKYNKLFCISDINVALLISQFKNLDSFIKKRQMLASVYIKYLQKVERVNIPIVDINKSVFFRFTIRIKNLNFESLKVFMDRKGIAVRKGVDSMLHNHDTSVNYPKANLIFSETISLPIYPSLDEKDIEYICNSFLEYKNEL